MIRPPQSLDTDLEYRSWGNQSGQVGVFRGLREIDSLREVIRTSPRPLLAYGNGRSYGDVCLNERGYLIDTRGLDRILSFDADSGVVLCEAGVTFDQILRLVLPHGWFV